ncbi:hypothetical protein [Falsibacillus albus]|uniref:Uncharacterized protein n=1 Tax=Falsibacillus albus TaxID=2478915 RepID=A0A3L7JXH8_9BACI|nr:hypothetical protein [Falsibacillus albus]RLQ95476.1 hypothetical protein D9X91_10610 [Falsibacillus albus]
MKKQLFFLASVYAATLLVVLSMDLIQRYTWREIKYNFFNMFYTLPKDDIFSLMIAFGLLFSYLVIKKGK